ncbi:MAG TPA: helix-turn-helix domain-containing protein [Planctomycetota bacterium]|nr:helix-turn-helix domain-containing protein [Planctomycetota bacterium]
MIATSSARSLERGIHVLNIMTGMGKVRAADILKRSDIPPASFFRILKVLVEYGLVSRYPDGKYALGTRTMMLGFHARENAASVRAVKPLLRELAMRTHLMAEFISASRWKLVTIESWVCESTPLEVASRPGYVIELDHLSAPGLCYLAFDVAFGLPRYLRKTTGMPQSSVEVLQTTCQRVRQKGYVWHTGTDGVARLSVPVFNRHDANNRRVRSTLNLVSTADELSAARASQLYRLLVKTSTQLADDL